MSQIAYRLRPINVQAIQYKGNFPVVEEFVGEDLIIKDGYILIPELGILPERRIYPENWIVKGMPLELMIFPDADFHAMFESVSGIQIPWTETKESSNVAGFSYDGLNRTLIVAFSGTMLVRYYYYDVPESEAKGMVSAESKGKYFYEHIKDRFRWEKRSPDGTKVLK